MWLGEWADFSKKEAREEDVVIFCQGAEALIEQQQSSGNGRADFVASAMGDLPKRLAKGEILTVKIPGLNLDQVVVRHGWMIPLPEEKGKDLYRVGSTYEWDEINGQPTVEGAERIAEIIGEFTDLPYEVVDHVAGIRPIMRQSRPVIGELQTTDGGGGREGRGDYWFFNGLGSKGTLYAPKVAQDFAEVLVNGGELDREY